MEIEMKKFIDCYIMWPLRNKLERYLSNQLMLRMPEGMRAENTVIPKKCPDWFFILVSKIEFWLRPPSRN